MYSGSLTEYNESYHDRSRHCSRISCSVACWTLRNQEQDELIDMDMGAIVKSGLFKAWQRLSWSSERPSC